MEISRLKEFIELSRRLNYTTAAKELHISQPALSNHIQGLEREAGTALVERSYVGGTRLTPAGQRLLEMAHVIVTAYDEALGDIASMKRDITGKVRVRMPRHEYNRPLLDYIFEFQRKYPSIDVALLPWVAEDGCHDVASGAVDVAFIGQVALAEGEETGIEGVKQTPYTMLEAYLWMDTSDPLAAKDELSVEDLNGRRVSISANQKNRSWILTMQSVAKDYDLDVELDEKYSDSLEDFLMNRVGAGDLVLNYGDLFGMTGLSARRDRIARAFTPPLMIRACVAHADRPTDEALQTFVEFLGEKYREAV